MSIIGIFDVFDLALVLVIWSGGLMEVYFVESMHNQGAVSLSLSFALGTAIAIIIINNQIIRS